MLGYIEYPTHIVNVIPVYTKIPGQFHRIPNLNLKIR